MQNKRFYIVLVFVILLTGVAAFLAGRMINRDVGTVERSGPNGGQISISLDDIIPAPELPRTEADISGSFVERKDNTIIVQAVSFGSGLGAMDGGSPMDENSGTRVEVVVTGKTMLYKDVTQFPTPVNGEIHNVQQAVDVGALDELDAQSFITVWGYRSGDRITANVLFYSNPETIKKP